MQLCSPVQPPPLSRFSLTAASESQPVKKEREKREDGENLFSSLFPTDSWGRRQERQRSDSFPFLPSPQAVILPSPFPPTRPWLQLGLRFLSVTRADICVSVSGRGTRFDMKKLKVSEWNARRRCRRSGKHAHKTLCSHTSIRPSIRCSARNSNPSPT